MKTEATPEIGYRFTFDTEEDQFGLLALCQIVLQCKKGSSEDYSSYDSDARRIARAIIRRME
jgi:hypothetical protein